MASKRARSVCAVIDTFADDQGNNTGPSMLTLDVIGYTTSRARHKQESMVADATREVATGSVLWFIFE
jgi:hypothetical protein